METTKLPLNKLIFADYNPRKDLEPGDPEYESLRRSIQEFGYISPIIVNKRNNVIVGGHQRAKVLRELGYEEIDVVLIDADADNEKLLNIALNKIKGDFDMEKLELVIKDIQEAGEDATITGFSEQEIEDLVGSFDPLSEDSDSADNSSGESEEEQTIVCPSCKHVAPKEAFKI